MEKCWLKYRLPVPNKRLKRFERIPSTAGLLLLQQLSATERIVFLLREVFHYRFDEIAEIVDKSTANCRQIFHRAKKGIGQLPDRSPEVMEKKTALAEQFAEALLNRNIGLLIELISTDTVLYTDGGGKVKAAIRPIIGSDRIIRYFVDIADEVPAGTRCETCEINGMHVMNPEKLSHFNETQKNEEENER